MNLNVFCQYRPTGMGICGALAKSGERCKRHLDKKEPVKKITSPKFRGKSKFNKELGGFENAVE